MAYEFPPLTPGDTNSVAARVAAVLDDAWQRLAGHQAAVLAAIGDNERTRMVADRIGQFQAAIVDFRQRVDAEARAFVTRQLPHLYEEGARAATQAAGGRFSWTLIHAEALQSLASDSYADFLRRSEEQQRMAAVFYRAVREAARKEVPQLAVGHTTALQAARDLADRLAAEHQLTYVIYRNGARMPVRAWAESATLAKSAVAYNAGTLNRASELGVRFMEVFDGRGCGWTHHRDPDKANGTIRSVEEAAAWPISHPRCQRAFGPRPDLGKPA
ncbi:phage minor capsid protein [Streptomyces sp. NPDC059787]|uniref:phage minor capsid protein n=1 Tax=Streptomyces sp. NPDC059787 TaxID=3346947 RepID=UPI0036531576